MLTNSLKVDERVIIDGENLNVQLPPEMSMMGDLGDSFRPVMEMMSSSRKEPMVQQTSTNDEFSAFDSHPPDKDFTPLQARLTPATVYAVSLRDKSVYEVSIACLSEVQWAKDSFNSLVLDKDTKTMLHVLIEQHSRNKDRVGGDFIQGKGKVRHFLSPLPARTRLIFHSCRDLSWCYTALLELERL